MTRRTLLLAVALGLALSAPAAAAPVLQLDPARGGLVLPNLDDDSGRCAAELARITQAKFSGVELAVCSDASNTVVDGPQDALDLAPLRVAPWPEAPDGTTGELVVTGPARVFRGTSPVGGLTTDDLRAGVELAVEATDIAREPGSGAITVALRVPGQPDSAVGLRVAPLVLASQTRPAERLFARAAPARAEVDRMVREAKVGAGKTVKLLRTAARADIPPFLRRWIGKVDAYLEAAQRQRDRLERDMSTFGRVGRSLATAVRKAGGAELTFSPDAALFVQDAFESTVASVPGGPGGRPHTMRVNILAGGLMEAQKVSPTNPQAGAISWPYRHLRGRDLAVVKSTTTTPYDATGALEATPPVAGAPLGKLLLSSTSDAGTERLLQAQAAQPVVRIDTSWLTIGHVDETIAFVPAATERGWVAVVADPRGALDLLADAPGSTKVVGTADALLPDERDRPSPTARALLRGAVARDSRTAARAIDGQLAVLRRELGLTDADIVRVPVLFGRPPGSRKLVAWTGNVVNGLAPSGRRFIAALPHGPVVKGDDTFAVASQRALKRVGVTTTWVDTYPVPHLRLGEIHCYTNAFRTP